MPIYTIPGRQKPILVQGDQMDQFWEKHPDAKLQAEAGGQKYSVSKDEFGYFKEDFPDYKSEIANTYYNSSNQTQVKPAEKQGEQANEDKPGFFGSMANRFAAGASEAFGSAANLVNKIAGSYNDAVNYSKGLETNSYQDNPLAQVGKEAKETAEEYRQAGDYYNGKGFTELFKEGHLLDAAGSAFLSATESLPQSLAIAMGGKLGLLAAFGTTASDKYDQLKEEYPEMPEWKAMSNALWTGASEALTEVFGAGTIGRTVKGLLAKGGKKEAADLVKKSFLDKLAKAEEKHWLIMPAVSEFSEESANALSEWAVDKMTGVQRDDNILMTMLDAGMAGAMGGVQFSPVIGAAKFQNNRIKNKVTKEFKQASDQVSGFLPDDQKAILIDGLHQYQVNNDLDNAQKFVDEFAQNMGASQEQYKMIVDLARASVGYNNYVDYVNDQIDQETKKRIDEINSLRNPEMGSIVQAKMGEMDNPVYIVGGTLAYKDDMSIDVDNSSDIIYFVDANGKTQQATPQSFSALVNDFPLEQAYNEAYNLAKTDVIQREEAGDASQFAPGQQVMTSNGVAGQVQSIDEEGNVIVNSNGITNVYKPEDLQIMQEQEQPTMQPDVQQEQAPAFPMDKDGNIDFGQISDPQQFADGLKQEFGDGGTAIIDQYIANEQAKLAKTGKAGDPIKAARDKASAQAKLDFYNQVKGAMGTEMGLTGDQNPINPIQQGEEYQSVAEFNANNGISENPIIPQNETENPIEQGTVPSDTQSVDNGIVNTPENPINPIDQEPAKQPTTDDMVADILDGELDDQEVDDYVTENKRAAQNALTVINNKKPKMSTNKAEYLAKRAAWQQEADAAQAEVDRWNEIGAKIAETRKGIGADEAARILSQTEPMNGHELAAKMLADGSIKLTHDSFKRETGGGTGEARGFFGLFARPEKGGVNIERAGEMLMLADLEAGTNFFDQNDPNAGRNAIIDVLSEARTRGDLINYIRNNREEQARREQEAQYNAYAQQIMDEYHMNPDEYEAYERLSEEAAKMLTPEQQAEIDGEIYDQIMQEQADEAERMAIFDSLNNNNGNGTTETEGDPGTAGGVQEESNEGNEVLPGQQISDTGRGEVLDKQGNEPVSNNAGQDGGAPKSEAERIKEAESEVDQNPTDAQKEAGNNKNERRSTNDLDTFMSDAMSISIEDAASFPQEIRDEDTISKEQKGGKRSDKVSVKVGLLDNDLYIQYKVGNLRSNRKYWATIKIPNATNYSAGQLISRLDYVGTTTDVARLAGDAILELFNKNNLGLYNVRTQVGLRRVKEAESKAPESNTKVEQPVQKKWSEMTMDERMKEAETNPLTKDQVKAYTGDDVIKANALAYINGKDDLINSIAYLKVYEDVRNSNGGHTQDNGTKDGTQLAQTDNAVNQTGGLGTRGTGGESAEQMDRGSRTADVSGKRSDVQNGEGRTDTNTGAQGDSTIPVEGEPMGGSDTRSDGREGSGTDSPNGRDGKRRGSKTGGTASTDTRSRTDVSQRKGSKGNDQPKAGRKSVKDIEAERKNALDEFNSILDQFVKAGKKDLSLSLAGLNNEQFEILPKLISAGAKVGYTYIQEGIYKLAEWFPKMRSVLRTPLQKVGFSEDEVDSFIKEMWKCNMPIDGVTRTLEEWAAILGEENLRKEVGKTINEKKQLQDQAESIGVKVGDRQNIEETLPYLLPQQRDDVMKAEVQFFDASHNDRDHGNGKGFMFTNGTGTGKTYTGLGIVKRFIKQGKGRVLIVTPSQTKVNDWIKDASNLNIDLRDLDSIAKEKGTTATTEAGDGAVITTFANFRTNKALLESTFDLVVYDESHRILENKSGAGTTGSNQHYMITNRNERYAYDRLWEINPLKKQIEDKFQEFIDETERIKNNNPSGRDMVGLTLGRLDNNDRASYPKLAEIERQYYDLITKKETVVEPQLREQAKQEVPKTKVVFLSATPFNTRENLEYAEGYIFSYPEEDKVTAGSYRHKSPRTEFYLQHFGAGYRFRYGHIEAHTKNAEALAKQEVDFSDYLQNELQTMSGRVIDSEYDYSRDFPTVTLGVAERFNEAVQEIKDSDCSHAMYQLLGDYNYSSALFETLKVSCAIPRIKEHLAKGRKVVVFHRRVESKNPIVPLFTAYFESEEAMLKNSLKERPNDVELKAALNQLSQLKDKYKDLLDWESTLDMSMPRAQLANEFGADNVLFFSGKESTKVKNQAVDTFNDDNSGKNIIVIQEASGKEGISLHDRTGEHQRALITLALPQSPITALQIEGRIYRIGNKSNAIFEYPLLGLDAEMILFGQRFNNQVGTTENLALGSKARNLRDSFARGVEERSGYIDPETQGFGGKDFDAPFQAEGSEYDRSVLDYYTNQKIKGRRDNREGLDYYPTPEPLGFKMVEWADIRDGDSALEPSAGHGAIARYVPRGNGLTAVEPSSSLFAKLQIKVGGSGRKFVNNIFEQYNEINKHDVVIMNPPFGKAGSTAVKHVIKAFNHLDEGGRLVALIPNGKTPEKLHELMGKEHKDSMFRGEILLPDIVFENAGTKVSCRVVIFDKVGNAKLRQKASPFKYDMSGKYDKVEDFFEDLRDVRVPERIIDRNAILKKRAKSVESDIKENKYIEEYEISDNGIYMKPKRLPSISIYWDGLSEAEWESKLLVHFNRFNEWSKEKDERQAEVGSLMKQVVAKLAGKTEDQMERDVNNVRIEAANKQAGSPSVQTEQPAAPQNDQAAYVYEKKQHTKTGDDMHMAMPKKAGSLSDDEYSRISKIAKNNGGYWNRFMKGFAFKTKEDADRFIAETMPKGNEGVSYQKADAPGVVSAEEAILRDALSDIIRQSGIEVIDNTEEGQRVLDEANGDARMQAKKRALETASLSESSKRSLTVVSSADGAKVLKNIDAAIQTLENSPTQPKTFVGDIAQAIGATRHNSKSEYATFETKNGRIVTIRLADHNATVSNFDRRGELDGISIVVSPKKNEGVTNDGDAHVVEYYYDAIKLRRTDGKPLANIVRSIKQALYSGEFNDTTGIAERQEVNADDIRQQKVNLYYDPRFEIQSVRGEWTKGKIIKRLKDIVGARTGYSFAAKRIAEFESAEELAEHMFYHGTQFGGGRLKPSILMSDSEIERVGGGGYGQKYWGISVSRSKRVASNFSTGRGVRIYPIILVKNARVKEMPELRDAADLEDHIEDLWKEGVDAVWIGDKNAGEQELCILNPAAIVNIDSADFYNNFKLGTSENPLHVIDSNGIEKLYQDAKRYVNALEDKPRKPQKPSRFLPAKDGEIIGEMKSDEQYKQEMSEYEQKLDEYNNSDEARRFKQEDNYASRNIRFFRTADGNAYGFTVGGKIYIDPRIATSETPIHEYAHIWASAIRKGNPKEWGNIVGLMKGTDIWNSVKDQYPELTSEDEIADEVLAQYSGKQGAAKLRAELDKVANGNTNGAEKAKKAIQNIKEALNKFWNSVADFLHIKYTSAEEVADRVMRDLLNGVNPLDMDMSEAGQSFAESLGVADQVEFVTDKEGLQGKRASAKGFFDRKTGKVTVVVPNHTSVGDMQATILHELVGHYGLRKLFGDKFDDMMDRTFKAMPKELRRAIAEEAISKYRGDIRTATEEYLASIAERGVRDMKLWEKIKAGIKDFFRSVGINLTMRDEDIAYMLWRSKNRLKASDTMLEVAQKIADDADMQSLLYRDGMGFGSMLNTPKVDRNGVVEISEWLKERLKNRSAQRELYLKVREGYQDNMIRVREWQREVERETGHKVQDHEDFYTFKNQTSSRAQYDMQKFQAECGQAIWDEIDKLAQKIGRPAGEGTRMIENYEMVKHGLERNAYMRQQAIDQLQYQATIDIDNAKTTLKGKQLQDAIDKINAKLNNEVAKYDNKDYSGLTALSNEILGSDKMDEAALSKWVDDFEKQYDTMPLWKAIREANNRTLQQQLRTGLISKETYDKISGMYKFYIPLKDWDGTRAQDLYEYENGDRDIIQNPLKHAKGRTTRAGNVLANIASAYESATILGYKNLANQRLLNFVRNSGTQSAVASEQWFIKSYDAQGNEYWQPAYASGFNEDPDHNAKVIADFEADMKQKQEQGLAKTVHEVAKLGVPVKAWQEQQHIVKVKEGGVDKTVYFLGDPRVSQAVNGLNNRNYDMWLIRQANNVRKFMMLNYTSRNVTFILRNLLRDISYVPTMSYVKYGWDFTQKYVKWLPKAMKDLAKAEYGGKADPEVENFYKNGGATGYLDSIGYERYKKEIDSLIKASEGKDRLKYLKKIFAAVGMHVERVNNIVENANRYAVYRAAKESGFSELKAIEAAKEASVNFNRRGSGQYGGAIAQNAYFFFNAAIQGTQNFGSAVANNKVRALKALGFWFALGVMFRSLSGLFGDDDDEYNQLPDYVRQNNLVIPLWKGQYLSIPLSIEIRAVYGLGDMIAQAFQGGYDDNKMGFVSDALLKLMDFAPISIEMPQGRRTSEEMAQSIMKNFVPDAAKPVYDVIFTNENFYGKRITGRNEYNIYIPEWQKASFGTSKALIEASKKLNEATGGDYATKGWADGLLTNPAVAEYLFEQYLGGVGKAFGQAYKTVEAAVTGDKVYSRNIPIVSGLTYSTENMVPKDNTSKRYNNYIDDFNEAQSRYKQYQKGVANGEATSEQFTNFVNSPEFMRYQIIGAYKKQVDGINDMRKALDPDDPMNETLAKYALETKRQMIERLKEMEE